MQTEASLADAVQTLLGPVTQSGPPGGLNMESGKQLARAVGCHIKIGKKEDIRKGLWGEWVYKNALQTIGGPNCSLLWKMQSAAQNFASFIRKIQRAPTETHPPAQPDGDNAIL